MEQNKTYFFISDIHLGFDNRDVEKEKEDLLLKFLNYAANNCNELFIVGDLFDYWFEYKRVYQKGYFRTLTALKKLTDAGIKLHYFIGNHDFLHRDFFEVEIGAKLYADPLITMLNGEKFFIGHGDGLIKKDHGYNILKKIFRNPVAQWLYSWVHPDIGIAIASKTSKTSREYTSKKDFGMADGLTDTAKEKIDNGFRYVIFGHVHKRNFLQYNTGYYINLGSWLDKPCYGKFTDKFEIVDWK
ncbi:MAG: UDP-2,3-diacylglucosamine diphosphatase [Ignavibacteriaceae bacterium]